MDLRLFSTFLRVAELQNFTKAAEQLGYSQATVTVQIHQLEQALGIQLFERIGKRVRMTEHGEQFIPYAIEILKAEQNAKDFLREPENPSGRLRIGTAESLLLSVLTPILMEYHHRYPDVMVSIHTGLIHELFDMVRQNDVDLLFFLVITNPVDAMTYLVKSISGLPDSKVMGTGTALDSARLRYFLADLIGVDARSLEAMCMGEHGDSQMIPWSQVTVGAKRIIDILRDSPERFRYVELDSIRKEIAKIAYQIVKQKGATNYGIAAVAARMIKAIIQDENIVMPLSVMPHGEYGLSDLYLGIPAVLNGSGIRELVEYHLTNQEHQALLASAAVLQEANQKVQQLVKW